MPNPYLISVICLIILITIICYALGRYISKKFRNKSVIINTTLRPPFYKKIFKSFTFYAMLISLLIIYLHYIGQDSKSIVLISLNPILNNLCYTSFADNVLNTGIQIACNTITGSIFINWYIAHFITFALLGMILDSLRLVIRKLNRC